MQKAPADAGALLFTFTGFGVRRYLHSFPTRRSSDLGWWRARFAERSSRSRSTRRRSPPRAHPIVRWEDRKSTRLNSSHRTISYAVFCLKKKNANAESSDGDGGKVKELR